MHNPYAQQSATVLKITRQTPDTHLLTLRLADLKLQKNFSFIHGQFVMLGIPGFGEAPFDIASPISQSSKYLEVSVRQVGELTQKLNELKKNDKILLRGPFGNGFPDLSLIKTKYLLLIGGGCGFVTMRSILEEINETPSFSPQVLVFYGAATPDNLLFKERFNTWQKKAKIYLSFDKFPQHHKGAGQAQKVKISGATCEMGLVTGLFDKVQIFSDTTAILCGPPIMYKFVLEKLKTLKIAPTNIYLSLERRMHCGLGVCQHCAVGPYYVCKDGPVFRLDQIQNYLYA